MNAEPVFTATTGHLKREQKKGKHISKIPSKRAKERQLRGAYLPHTLSKNHKRYESFLGNKYCPRSARKESPRREASPLSRFTPIPNIISSGSPPGSPSFPSHEGARSLTGVNPVTLRGCVSANGGPRSVGELGLDPPRDFAKTVLADNVLSESMEATARPATCIPPDGLYSEYSFRPAQYRQLNDRGYRKSALVHASEAVRDAETIWDRLISRLRSRGAKITYHDLLDISNMKTIPEQMLPVLGYVCILLGLSPAAKLMKRTIFKELIPLHLFLREIEPLSLPLRRIRKAYHLRLLITDEDIATMAGEYQGIRNLLHWVDAFQAVASLILSVDDHRKFIRKEANLQSAEWCEDVSILPVAGESSHLPYNAYSFRIPKFARLIS
jgi:hypothetical protein